MESHEKHHLIRCTDEPRSENYGPLLLIEAARLKKDDEHNVYLRCIFVSFQVKDGIELNTKKL